MFPRSHLYLEGLAVNETEYELSLESFITYFIYKILGSIESINIIIVEANLNNNILVEIRDSVTLANKTDLISTFCKLPILYNSKNTIIAGLCGTCRGIIKLAISENGSSFGKDLLGFKLACLLSPTESSVWTKFCEIDIIECTKQFTEKIKLIHNNLLILPDEILKFESHMSQPIRTHNVYKLARDLQNDKSIKSNIPVEDLNINHAFAESHKITLADVILFACYSLIFEIFGDENLTLFPMPLTKIWFNNLKSYDNNILDLIYNSIRARNEFKMQPDVKFIANEIENYSLYKSDPKRYKPRNRIFTKQIDLDEAFSKIENLNVVINSQNNVTPGRKTDFTWNDIPYDGLPEGGKLPQKRLNRKKEQLENLAREVIAIAKDNDVIVDFCSGSGHLGIILACKLPNCKIILVENKEESLNIAKKRTDKLNIDNIEFFQCNLDYFTRKFDIGTSLHACGVATDIVLQHCLRSNASFVCSPCCYGKIIEMPHIKYPRSHAFQEHLLYNDYLVIAHCSDQTHDIENDKVNVEKSLQGEYCMDIIDTDRITQAKELNYNVLLTRMMPEKCSLKNRLLIGYK